MVVAEEFQRRSAMETVGAGLGDGVHHRAAEAAVLGVEAVRDQPELSHRIDVRNDRRSHVAALADVASIHQECVRPFTGAIHGDVAGVFRIRRRQGDPAR